MRILSVIFLISIFISAVACQAGNKNQTFDEFWSEFRTSVLSDDYEKLNNLVQLPLEVRGAHDDIPAEFVSAEQLKEITPKLLDQTIFLYEQDDLKETTFREIIKNMKTADIQPDKTRHRIEQFEFELVKGRWLLVRAYLE